MSERDPFDVELDQLREALSTVRGSMLRMTCKTPGVIHLRAEDWYRAFAPFIVPPYNRLRWEQEADDQRQKQADADPTAS